MTSKPQFRQINAADVSDDDINILSNSMNVPKLIRSSTQPAATDRHEAVTPPSRRAVEPARPSQASDKLQKTTFRIPETLNDAMKIDALEGRINVRLIVLAALRRAGYRIEEASLPATVPTARRPAVTPSRGRLPAQHVGPSKQQKLSIDIPGKVTDALKRDAIEQGTSIRVIVLRALIGYGYLVADADLAPGAGGNC